MLLFYDLKVGKAVSSCLDHNIDMQRLYSLEPDRKKSMLGTYKLVFITNNFLLRLVL